MSHREMFEIRCSDCGKTEMVPFYPVGGKPIYCRACFSKYKARGVGSVWGDSRPEPRQTWARKGEGWQRRKREDAGGVSH